MVHKSENSFHRDSVEPLPLLKDLYVWPNSEMLSNGENVEVLSNGKKEPQNREEFVTVVRKSSSSSKKSSQNTSVNLDLTGSPLKASFSLDDDDEEDVEIVSVSKVSSKGPSFLPLKTRLARKLVSNQDKTKKFTPMFAVCDNEDGTLFLGASRSYKGALTLFKVQNEGLVTSKDEAKIFHQLLANHNKHDPEGVKNIQARAIYDMSQGTVGSEMTSDEDLSSLKLRFLWNKPRSILETPPGYANIELLAKLSFIDDRLACCDMFKDIELLQGYKSGLENQGIKWIKRQDNDSEFMESLRELLVKVKQMGPKSTVKAATNKNETKHDGSFDDNILVLTERLDLDLTDLLWNVLKKVESFEELKKAWEFIFQVFEKEEVRPYIHGRNSTKVAKIVRSIVKQEDIDLPKILGGPEVLEMLMEIGIEKLKRDYTQTLLNNTLATRGDLAKIIEDQNEILVLKKLHCIQCLICLCQTFLPSNQGCLLRSVVQQSIKILSENKIEIENECPEFVFNIRGSDVKDQINTLCPTVWQCHFSSIGSVMELRTTCHLSIEPATDVIEVKNEIQKKDEDDDEDMSKKVEYHVLNATAITRNNM